MFLSNIEHNIGIYYFTTKKKKPRYLIILLFLLCLMVKYYPICSRGSTSFSILLLPVVSFV